MWVEQTIKLRIKQSGNYKTRSWGSFLCRCSLKWKHDSDFLSFWAESRYNNVDLLHENDHTGEDLSSTQLHLTFPHLCRCLQHVSLFLIKAQQTNRASPSSSDFSVWMWNWSSSGVWTRSLPTLLIRGCKYLVFFVFVNKVKRRRWTWQTIGVTPRRSERDDPHR